MLTYVHGRAKGSFRASCWAWPPLVDVIATTGVLADEMVRSMRSDCGAGPRDQRICDKLAIALQGMLDEDPRELLTAVGEEVDRSHDEEVFRMLGVDSPRYAVKRAKVQDFIGFLRECGGFSVWVEE